MDWDTPQLWRKQIERRLNELGSLTWGNQRWQADRIADVIEQIEEVRKEVREVAAQLDKAREAFVQLRAQVRSKED